MCPTSGMVQFLIVIVTLLLVCHAVVVRPFKISFTPKKVILCMYDSVKINYEITDIVEVPDDLELLIYSENKNIASLEKEIIISNPQANLAGSFNITGNFLGQTVIACKNKRTDQTAEGNLDVVVIRKKRFIDKVFTASVATLVSILYINFGCAIDWGELPSILKRPIGPAIGFSGQFIVMPLLSYTLGIVLFPDSPEMQLGMFFTGASPGGGASNVWTVLLDGNISLSIIMTAISTIAAFAMMPLWIFTLGRCIFQDAKLEVPYIKILTYVIALIVPLAIGYLIQRYLKRVAYFMTKIIKIVVAGMGLPWIGYVAGYLLARAFNQTPTDSLTIAIEIGIQNSGIAIFLLRFALPQPQADLTTVAPVAVATLTPFPLLFLFLYKKLMKRLSHSHSKLNCCEEDLPKIDNIYNGNGTIEAFNEEKIATVT